MNGNKDALPPPTMTDEQQKQENAAASMASEDERMKRFLRLLAYTSSVQTNGADGGIMVTTKGNEAGDGANTTQSRIRSGSTVPNALCRRIIHRHGGGYLDETVAAVASGTADRFLATVLQQGVTCRDRRLKGEDLAKRDRMVRRAERKRQRKEMEGRRRKKAKKWNTKREKAMAAVGAEMREAAEAASKKGGRKSPVPESPNSKKSGASKYKMPNVPDYNGDADHDSVDEEEEFYHDYYGKGGKNGSYNEGDSDDGSDEDDDEDYDEYDYDDDEEDESRYTLLLRDLVRPLGAWNMSIAGKLGLGAVELVSEESKVGEDDAGDVKDEEDDDAEEEDDAAPTGEDEDADMKEADGEDSGTPPVSPEKEPAKKKVGGGTKSKGTKSRRVASPAPAKKKAAARK